MKGECGYLWLHVIESMEYIKGLVSVVIPTYKRSDSIVKAIDSVLDQKYKNIECLVVNDNEKDDEYSSNLYLKLHDYIINGKITLLEQDHHINGAAARNFGIKHARGEYIAFLDDDDWWSPDKIDKQVNFINQQSDECGAVSTLVIFYRGDKAIRKTSCYPNGRIYKEILSREYEVITSTTLIKHAVLDQTGYFDENLKRHQEIQLLGYLSQQYSIVLLPEYLTFMSVDDNGNRPDADKLIQYKAMFFQSVEPILSGLGKKEKRMIIYMHKIEVINALLKEKRITNAVVELVKLLTCPKAFFKTLLRIKRRMSENKL